MTKEDTIALMLLVVGVVLVIRTLAQAYQRRLKLRERELELAATLAAERAAAQITHNGQLEARLRVLERIATDRGASLAESIEALRGPSVN